MGNDAGRLNPKLKQVEDIHCKAIPQSAVVALLLSAWPHLHELASVATVDALLPGYRLV